MAVRFSRGAVAATIACGVLVLGLALAGSSPAPAGAQGGGLSLKRIAGGLDAPVYVENAPGSAKLLFVVEQPGQVRVLRKGKLLEQAFVNLEDIVNYGGEQGLLSIAFHPRYARNRRFYVYYVTERGNIRVDQMKRKKSSATRADRSSRHKLIEIAHPTFSNHNGGQLQFGPDGFLYLATGDGGSSGDPDANAQNKSSLLGKLLRLDPKKGGGYSVPDSNPFAGGANGAGEIYALGLRNPYRFSFDAKSGAIAIADVGQDKFEEINHLGLDSARGANFGWDLFEGNSVFDGNGEEPANYKGADPPVRLQRQQLRGHRRLRLARPDDARALGSLPLRRLLRRRDSLARPRRTEPKLDRLGGRPQSRLPELLWRGRRQQALRRLARRRRLSHRPELTARCAVGP